MTTIVLPPDVEQPLAEAARRQGKSPEELAVDSLRRLFPPHANGATRPDRIKKYIGAWDGPSGPFAENIGNEFADGMEEKQRMGEL